MLEQKFIESVMDKAWPACERKDTGEWVLRASDGVTQRANSVWPKKLPGEDGHTVAGRSALVDAVRSASDWYRKRRLPAIFQVFDDHRSSALNAVLDEQRFSRQSVTRIMIRGVDGRSVVPTQHAVELSEQPSEEWLQVWWSVDGRGGDAALSTARKILMGCQSVYALVRDDDGVPAAVGRLALVDGWGGIYSMATTEAHRRRGYASTVLAGLLNEGTARRLEGFWLLVTDANKGAQALYSQSGFTDYGSYLYRQAPLKRAPGGC
ncbi:GNAT family N-acetyltransferase [Paenarthrobacter sp. NPDC056912]|uniref:GNAT family N-acetyltransferase n=1 Tax=Paenarthrobacter sp. NPDC056912 TaxID=3345965 RepID=UPI003671556C